MGVLLWTAEQTGRLAMAMCAVVGVATLLSACSDEGLSGPPATSSTAIGTWTPTGSLGTGRDLHTATLLPNGTVLVAGGLVEGIGFLASAELYDPATKTWSPTGNLAIPRAVHTATLLPTGKVLVVGGSNLFGALASTELYDPATGSWSLTGGLATARENHTATLLPNGIVLVVGGRNSSDGTLSSAELYDPATGSWSLTGGLATARENHTATLLPTGMVLVVGGHHLDVSGHFSALISAELYDPATGTWSPTGSLAIPRAVHTATLLPTGKVLVVGGTSFASAELYDPTTRTWSPTDNLAFARADHTATLLPTGKVLVVGGYIGGNNVSSILASAELYDPIKGTWSPTGALTHRRVFHTATLLPSGMVLVVGGEQFDISGHLSVIASAELYHPATTGAWSLTGPLRAARTHHTATLLPTGKVLVVGGDNSFDGTLSSAELYDPAMGTWHPTGALTNKRAFHTATLLPNGTVLVVGGDSGGGNFLASAELYDPATGTWSPTGALVTVREFHTATLLPTGKVLVVGGFNFSGGVLASAELYDPTTGTWSPTGALMAARDFHTATLLPSGKVLVVGGGQLDLFVRGTVLSSAELYDPTTGTWSPTGALMSARAVHTATLLSSGKVLVVGGGHLDNFSNANVLASAELYDPATGTWISTGGLMTARGRQAATLLSTGIVLVVGGDNFSGGIYLASAELYDQTTGIWSPTGALRTARALHTVTLLPTGTVLVMGGDNFSDSGGLASAELLTFH